MKLVEFSQDKKNQDQNTIVPFTICVLFQIGMFIYFSHRTAPVDWVQVFIAIGTVGATVVGFYAIRSARRSSYKSLRIGKLEELYTLTNSIDEKIRNSLTSHIRIKSLHLCIINGNYSTNQ